MRDVMRAVVLGGMLIVLGASVAAAAPPAGRKCQSAKTQEAGKYAACMSKAEAKLLKAAGTCSVTTATECYADGDCPMGETCAKSLEDTDKYTATVGKCLEKFNGKWNSLTDKAVAAADPCPDGLASSEIQDAVDLHVANVAAGLAGEGLSTCSGELVTCEGDLTTCSTDLGTAEAGLTTCGNDLATAQADLTTCGNDLGTAQADLTTCDGNLTTCDGNLTTCEGDLVAALACGDGGIDAGEDCDLGNLNGGTCAGEGFAGGVLRCGAGCVYDTSECVAARFVDNANGTITDNDTGLTWEKKVKLDSTSDLANRQDADNSYPWSGTCSIGGALCQPDAASEAVCLARVEGNNNGCAQCVSGVCNVGSTGVTAWQWLAALNGASFGGHNDWRLATKSENLSIIDDTDATAPVVNIAFHGASCGVACTDINNPACSCTRSALYWSGTTFAPGTNTAWDIGFAVGEANAAGKTGNLSVRAVRGGS